MLQSAPHFSLSSIPLEVQLEERFVVFFFIFQTALYNLVWLILDFHNYARKEFFYVFKCLLIVQQQIMTLTWPKSLITLTPLEFFLDLKLELMENQSIKNWLWQKSSTGT